MVQSAVDILVREAHWPHMHVRRSGQDNPEWDNLPPEEFGVGFLRIVERFSTSTQLVGHLQYLRKIYEDAHLIRN